MAPLVLLALQAAWKGYVLDGVAVSLPSTPKESPAPPVAKEKSRYWTSLHNGRNVLLVASTRLDPKVATPSDQILAASVAGTLATGDATLLSQEDAVRQGWPAIQIRWRGKDGWSGVGETVVFGGRILQFGVLGRPMAALEAPFAKLAVSVRLPDDAGVGPQKAAGPTFARYPLEGSPASVELPAHPKPFEVPTPAAVGGGAHAQIEARYGNRGYRALFAEIPEAARFEAEGPGLIDGLRTFNEHAVADFAGKSVTSINAQIEDGAAIRTSGTFDEGRMCFRVESTVRDGRLYGFLAIVPTALRDGPEVARFFASIRLRAAK